MPRPVGFEFPPALSLYLQRSYPHVQGGYVEPLHQGCGRLFLDREQPRGGGDELGMHARRPVLRSTMGSSCVVRCGAAVACGRVSSPSRSSLPPPLLGSYRDSIPRNTRPAAGKCSGSKPTACVTAWTSRQQ